MTNQSGGSFTMSGWLGLFLVAALVAVGAYTIHLLHRQSLQQLFERPAASTQLSPMEITPKDDYFVTHTFPAGRDSCDGFNTICYSRI